jgi:hypothetical protein
MLEANAGDLFFRQRTVFTRRQRFIQHDVANTFTMQATTWLPTAANMRFT